MSSDEQNLVAAMGALERGNASRALEHLQSLESPTPEAWLLRAHALRLNANESEAEEALRRGLSMDAQHVGLRLALADMLADHDPKHAEQLYLEVLNDYPTENLALLKYAWLLATNSDADGAALVMERVPGHIRASDPFALSTEGVIALSNGKVAESRKLLDRGLASDPNSVFLHYLQALHESVSGGRVNRMAAHLDAAAASNPRAAGALGYEARYLNHPLLLPSRVVDRIGPARLWIGWIIVFFGLRAVWPEGPIGWIVLVYVVLALYTWIAPPLLRKWLKRKGEL